MNITCARCGKVEPRHPRLPEHIIPTICAECGRKSSAETERLIGELFLGFAAVAARIKKLSDEIR